MGDVAKIFLTSAVFGVMSVAIRFILGRMVEGDKDYARLALLGVGFFSLLMSVAACIIGIAVWLIEIL